MLCATPFQLKRCVSAPDGLPQETGDSISTRRPVRCAIASQNGSQAVDSSHATTHRVSAWTSTGRQASGRLARSIRSNSSDDPFINTHGRGSSIAEGPGCFNSLSLDSMYRSPHDAYCWERQGDSRCPSMLAPRSPFRPNSKPGWKPWKNP